MAPLCLLKVGSPVGLFLKEALFPTMTLKKMHGKDARAASKYLCVKYRVRGSLCLSRKPNNGYITSIHSSYASGCNNTLAQSSGTLCPMPRGWFYHTIRTYFFYFSNYDFMILHFSKSQTIKPSFKKIIVKVWIITWL